MPSETTLALIHILEKTISPGEYRFTSNMNIDGVILSQPSLSRLLQIFGRISNTFSCFMIGCTYLVFLLEKIILKYAFQAVELA